MGIKGLHAHMGACCEEVDLERLRGLRLAVDATGWLFRGACGAAGDGADVTEAACQFVLHRVKILARYGAVSYLVFDGDSMPLKERTANEREGRREVSLQRAVAAENALIDLEDEDEIVRLQSERRRGYIGSVKLSREMVERAIQVIEEEKRRMTSRSEDENKCFLETECIVAPYEADAQIIALALSGHSDVVVTEDSDAYAYLAAFELGTIYLCNKMEPRLGRCRLFKFGLGPRTGCSHLRSSHFFTALRAIGDFDHTGSVGNKFLQMCILAGCDYAESLLGSVSAATRVAEHRFVQDHQERWRRILCKFSLHGSRRHQDAELAFYYSRVFDLRTKQCIPLHQLKPTILPPMLPPQYHNSIDHLLGPIVDFNQRQCLFPSPSKPSTNTIFFNSSHYHNTSSSSGHTPKNDSIPKYDDGPPTTRLPCATDESQILTQQFSQDESSSPQMVHDQPDSLLLKPTTNAEYEIDPDDVCPETLAQLPLDIRLDIQRKMILARRSVRALKTVNIHSTLSATAVSSLHTASSRPHANASKKRKKRSSLLPPCRNLFHFFSSNASSSSSNGNSTMHTASTIINAGSTHLSSSNFTADASRASSVRLKKEVAAAEEEEAYMVLVNNELDLDDPAECRIASVEEEAK